MDLFYIQYSAKYTNSLKHGLYMFHCKLYHQSFGWALFANVDYTDENGLFGESLVQWYVSIMCEVR